jgi:hypothetical protein
LVIWFIDNLQFQFFLNKKILEKKKPWVPIFWEISESKNSSIFVHEDFWKMIFWLASVETRH